MNASTRPPPHANARALTFSYEIGVHDLFAALRGGSMNALTGAYHHGRPLHKDFLLRGLLVGPGLLVVCLAALVMMVLGGAMLCGLASILNAGLLTMYVLLAGSVLLPVLASAHLNTQIQRWRALRGFGRDASTTVYHILWRLRPWLDEHALVHVKPVDGRLVLPLDNGQRLDLELWSRGPYLHRLGVRLGHPQDATFMSQHLETTSTWCPTSSGMMMHRAAWCQHPDTLALDVLDWIEGCLGPRDDEGLDRQRTHRPVITLTPATLVTHAPTTPDFACSLELDAAVPLPPKTLQLRPLVLLAGMWARALSMGALMMVLAMASAGLIIDLAQTSWLDVWSHVLLGLLMFTLASMLMVIRDGLQCFLDTPRVRLRALPSPRCRAQLRLQDGLLTLTRGTHNATVDLNEPFQITWTRLNRRAPWGQAWLGLELKPRWDPAQPQPTSHVSLRLACLADIGPHLFTLPSYHAHAPILDATTLIQHLWPTLAFQAAAHGDVMAWQPDLAPA